MSQTIELRIILSEDGGIRCAGPIDDLILCFGLLEAAKQSLIAHNAKKRQAGIVGATMNDIAAVDQSKAGL